MRIVCHTILITPLILLYASIFLLTLPISVLALLTYEARMQGRQNTPLVILLDVVVAFIFLPLTLILIIIYAIDRLCKIITSRLKDCVWMIYKIQHTIRRRVMHPQ